jgi:spermidine synthase
LRLGLPLGAFCASVLLFFVPLSLLAALGPMLIRLFSCDILKVGSTAGKVGFVSTIGSAFGAVATGYSSIPNRHALVCIGIGVVVLGWLLFALVRKPRCSICAVIVSIVSVGVTLFGLHRWPEWRFAHAVELETVNSPFGIVQVLSLPGTSTYLYLNDFLVVNTYDAQLKAGQDAYTHLLQLLASSYTGRIQDALCIGMAAGIVPMDLARRGIRVDAVEINPAALRLATKYFDFDTNLVNVILQDGRYVLNRTDRKFDVVIIDAYVGESAPNQLLSKEAFRQVQRVLQPDGTVVISSAASSDGSSSFFLASVQKTLREVFHHVRIHDTRAGSAFFVASNQPLAPKSEAALDTIPPAVRWIVRKTLSRIQDAELPGGIVITDDFNPLDFHEARNRQAIRRRILERIQTL